tara:strand:- start:4204 stop:5034 length:831 start_codon:yes stop_codon:yes gene_type:complete
MKFRIILTLLLYSSFIKSQVILEDYALNKIIDETSGLEMVQNFFITHNDSGGEAALYYLSINGKIEKKRKIDLAKNKDWEDITRDKKYFYIADSGNNYNNRKDLKIYKVPIDEGSDENTKIISFNYPEQKSFVLNRNTIYDGEGLISLDKDLLLFTKNRASKITELYLIPKKEGNYNAKKIGQIDTKSIVTGADYDPKLKLLVLTSTLMFNEYYLNVFENFSIENFANIKLEQYEIPIGKTQVEAIKIIDEKSFWITSEDESSSKSARLMKISIEK